MNRIVILLLIMFTACTVKKEYIPVGNSHIEVVTVKDTIVYTYLERVRDSIQTRDSISYLFNKYSYSFAAYSRGVLSHSLGTFNDSIPVKIQTVTTHITDTVNKVNTVEIEKKLSKMDSLKLALFDVILFAILILCSIVGFRLSFKK